MKKSIRSIILLVILSFATITTLHAQTIDEVQQEQQKLQSEQSQSLTELENKKMSLQEVIDAIQQSYNEQQTLQTEMTNIQGQIAVIQGQINETQAKIDNLVDRAGASLSFYQEVSVSNPVIEQAFNNEGTGSQSYEEAMVTNDIMNSGMDYINEAVALQQQLEQQQTDLNNKNIELQNTLTQVQNKIAEQEALREKANTELASAQEHYDGVVDSLVAQQKLAQRMEEAGCQPGQVYGVDCGVTIQSSGAFGLPTASGYVSWEIDRPQYPADRTYTGHTGIDIGAPTGTPVYAVGSGQVIAAGYGIVSGGGNHVEIAHVYNGRLLISAYSHLSSINVTEGQMVDQGTVIGAVGETGNAYGAHLHLEFSYDAYGWSDGDPSDFLDPRQFINFPPAW